jgi:diacylglycerol kinase family enzyme
VVEVKGKKYKFLNNVGFGIDGYCCEVGDKQRAAGKQKINYTLIAIKGLLGGYKKVCATVKVDGMTKSYKNVWLAPTMNGNYYGGGMKITPQQNRLNKERTVTVAVWHGSGVLKTLMMFPKIFEGLLSQYPRHISYFTGKQIKVEFDSPRDLQIDGETVRDVSEYSVNC